jgi:zinc transport system substrate-binding protein
MEDDEHGEHDDPTPQEIIDSFDSNNDSKLSWDEFRVAWSEDEHDDHDDHNETDEHDEHAVGYVSIHIEAEGDYGFALPMDVEFYILSEDSPEGHDHHGHDEDGHDEDGHDEDGHDEDDTIDAGDDESFMYDPHSWLDPVAFAAQVDVVLEKLILTFPNGTSNFTENANSYKVQLQDLDDKYEAAFGDAGTCFVGGHEKTIVANHNAYSYISARYDIEIITLYGLDPEGEPSPEDIIGVINHIAENNITVLFIEEFTSQTAVNSIVEDTGVVVNTLYTMEMAPSNNDDNYMTMMNKNLNNIVNGIGC